MLLLSLLKLSSAISEQTRVAMNLHQTMLACLSPHVCVIYIFLIKIKVILHPPNLLRNMSPSTNIGHILCRFHSFHIRSHCCIAISYRTFSSVVGGIRGGRLGGLDDDKRQSLGVIKRFRDDDERERKKGKCECFSMLTHFPCLSDIWRT